MKLIRLKKVLEITSLKRSSMYSYISEGLFPRPVSLGRRSVAWIEAEIIAWVEARIQERNERTDA